MVGHDEGSLDGEVVEVVTVLLTWEAGASFVRNGHVVYEKWWEKWETDVECLIDMVDGSVNVEFTNHKPVE